MSENPSSTSTSLPSRKKIAEDLGFNDKESKAQINDALYNIRSNLAEKKKESTKDRPAPRDEKRDRDIAAVADFVRTHTLFKTICKEGHSQGTFEASFVMLEQRSKDWETGEELASKEYLSFLLTWLDGAHAW